METDPKIESNFEVDDPEIKRLLREMGFIIGAGLPKGWVLLCFFSISVKPKMAPVSISHPQSETVF
jgi:hypothetical protein